MPGRRDRSAGEQPAAGLVDSQDPWVVLKEMVAAHAAQGPRVPSKLSFDDEVVGASTVSIRDDSTPALPEVPRINLDAALGASAERKRPREGAQPQKPPAPPLGFPAVPSIGAKAPPSTFAAFMSKEQFRKAVFRVTLQDGCTGTTGNKYIDACDKWPARAVKNMAYDLHMEPRLTDTTDPVLSAAIRDGINVLLRANVSGSYYLGKTTWERIS